ncbi:MAG: 3-oxoacyl-ACP synthase III family protein [Mycobacterium sp.]
MLPRLFFSRPGVVLPETAVDNDEALRRVEESFRGSAEEWELLDAGVRYVFERCNTRVRYYESDEEIASPGDWASRAASACMAENGITAGDLDMVVYGGVARDAFEPATADEVAGRLGATPVIALDVTCACAGLLEALHVVAGYFALHDEINTALICAGEVTRDRIAFDMQTVEEVMVGVAGLTIGNGAAALLVTRTPLPLGGARLERIVHKTLPENWELCRAPVDGHFMSQSKELFALSIHVAPLVRELLAKSDWTPEEINHYAFHQPSDAVLKRVFKELNAKPEAGVLTHSLYGNTASTAWAFALNHRIRTLGIASGDKIVIGSAAAGFTMVAASAEWQS